MLGSKPQRPLKPLQAMTPFDLSGSEVARVEWVSGGLHIRFSALAVSQWREQGADRPLAGHLGPVDCLVSCARAFAPGPERLVDCLGRVSEGRLLQAGQPVPLAVPSEISCDLVLDLHFANGEQLLLQAQAVQISLPDNARFTDDLAC